MGDCGVESGVVEFYKNSTILITGGTGFIGKVLLEKLLRCFEVRKVYLLIREKRSTAVGDRLKEMLDDAIFSKIRATTDADNILAKVIPIEVDFQSDAVISAEHQRLLTAEVQIVFNVMASVKFNEDIETAINTNVLSSRKLFQLASRFPGVRSIVHVSTFYSNCHRAHIEEHIYEDLPFGGYENILNVFRFLSAEEKAHLKPLILGPMPNSYTLSKRCAEVMIRHQFAHLPIAIFRPPIVSNAYREPVPGWVDNFNGAAGMVVPACRGLLYWIRGKEDVSLDVIPVDYCVNALLAVGWDNARSSRKLMGNAEPPVRVYNYVSQGNPLYNRDVGSLVVAGLQTTVARIFGRYASPITSSVWIRQLIIYWLLLQAIIADLFSMLAGKSKKNYVFLKRVINLDEATSYFRCRSWTAANDNIRTVWSALSVNEKRLLPFDVDTLDWKEYFRSFAPGVAAAIHRCELKRQTVCKSERGS
ncbi:fatty acyl-CoA reductase 1-like [Anopheles aquasalis]|uniref:fatty acyl-CoA reductase 1-like n=1 Tax=Anopheles aquasalis TaxID=42839 RepID=UPI00215B3C42|nr:fatty acyl-CoA reductase 1-like [Anopheles aquasalis]